MASFLAIFITLSAYFSASKAHSELKLSAVSAAPAFLPEPPALSPGIEPEFPRDRGAAPSPYSSLPVIPASPSPPNPDDFIEPAAPDVLMPISPSGSLPLASAASSGPSILPLILTGLLAFSAIQITPL